MSNCLLPGVDSYLSAGDLGLKCFQTGSMRPPKRDSGGKANGSLGATTGGS